MRVVLRQVTRVVVAIGAMMLASQQSWAYDTHWVGPSSGSNDFAASGNWDSGEPGLGGYGLIQIQPATGTTNIIYRDGNYDLFVNNGSGGGFVVQNTAASGSGLEGNNLFLINSGHFSVDFPSVGPRGILEISNGASLSAWKSFDLSNSGTLILNNGLFAYGGEAIPIFDFAGTVVVQNSGTYDGTASGAHDAFHVQSGGQVLVQSGTFTISVGNADGYGGVTIDSGAQVQIATNATLVIDESAAGGQGWNKHSPTNNGAVYLAGGALTTSDGFTQNTAHQIVNGTSGLMSGNGNLAFSLHNAGSLLASNGTLTATLDSFTNSTTSFLGTQTTNAVLNVGVPSGAGLVNQGTISLGGGTLQVGGTSAITITNTSSGSIIGVGDVTDKTIVNNGTIMAANPVSGVSVFSVGLSEFNTATIGASNGAVLNAVISGGSGTSMVNSNQIVMLGGTFMITNAAPGVITNNALIVGNGTIVPAIVTTNGSVVASGGVLTVGLLGGLNSGLLSNVNSGASLRLTNTFALNQGTIALNAGGLMLAGSVLTNQSLISGPGDLSGSLWNDTAGLVVAAGGTFNVATNTGETVNNLGTFQVSSGGTLNVVPDWNNTNGTVLLAGGTLTGGAVTNKGLFLGTGTINSLLINGTAGTIQASNGTLEVLSTAVNQLGTLSGGQQGTLRMTNLTQNLVNQGTMVLDSASGATNQAFYILRQSGGAGEFTNAVGATIQGAGFLQTGDFQPGGRNFSIWNQGSILATNGALILQPADAYLAGGFVNLGTVQVANAATFGIQRSTNAWNLSGTVPRNEGLILLDGGSLTLYSNPGDVIGVRDDAAFSNAVSGTIRGFGNFQPGLVNLGTLAVTNGLMTMANRLVTPINLGTITVANGATLQFNSSNAWQNSGTVSLLGGSLRTGGDTNANVGEPFTNSVVIRGSGTLIGGGAFGSSGTGFDKSIVNLGTITASNLVSSAAATLTIDAGGALANAGIQNLGTLVIASNATLSLIRGAAPIENDGSLVVAGGTLTAGGVFSNNASGRVLGWGTVVPSVFNSGTLLANSAQGALHLAGAAVVNEANATFGAVNGALIVDAVFTNAGTVSFLHSVGTFNSAVVNQGAWVMDPSTNTYFGDFTVATNGYLTMTAGDVSIFKSNFFNHSTLSNSYNTLDGTFAFTGTGGNTQAFFVTGIDMLGTNAQPIGALSQTNAFLSLSDPTVIGYSNNFALGRLEIGSLTSTSTLALIDTLGTIEPSDGKKAALYVNQFDIAPGSLLIISNNVEFYFQSSNGVTGISFGSLTGDDNVLILGDGGFHQLVLVPEPSIFLLMLLGAGALEWWHRRR